MKKFFRSLLFLWLLSAVARAQNPSPFTSERAIAATAPAGGIVAENRANEALQAGFPATAAAGYREILAGPFLLGETKQRVTLALVSALLEEGNLTAAEKALQDYSGPKNGAYQLRAGLLAAQARRWPQAKAALNATKPDELAPADRGWWYFLQANLADAENDLDRRNKAYEEAARVAVSDLQRLRFVLGREQARLRIDPPSEAQLAIFRTNMERVPGSLGIDYTRSYAAALSMAGRKPEALGVLQRRLALLPATERSSADQLNLLLGLIAGGGSEEGRRALFEILNKSQQPEIQRLALLLLKQAANTETAREQLRNNLGELIDAPVTHPIIEDLRLARAQAALNDRKYKLAEADAQILLERYPGSPLKPAALGVRLSVAWETGLYRAAAELSAQMRAALPEGRERTELGVLLAEAFFLSGDYQNAADAYDAALHEVPEGKPAGDLIFQRVLSDIRAERLEAAEKLLNEMAGKPGFDTESRWQAEWNLVKEMQVHRQGAAAQLRVAKLLQQGAAEVPDGLRIRFLWLRAKLSYDTRQFETAVTQADELVKALPGTKIAEELRAEVVSTALLLKAQALLELAGRAADAEALLEKLRLDYKNTKAAVYSYIVQASRLSSKGDIVKAQQLLIKLADEHPESEYAPLALYEAALAAESRELDDSLTDANKILEQRLIKNYPNDELVFYARLKQGDILRKLNEFVAARQVYQDLINNQGRHPDVLLAQIGLADSLFAQGGSVVNAESAAAIFEYLRDLPSAPVDLRVEAGYMWGAGLAKRRQQEKLAGDPVKIEKALTRWWSVVNDFLRDPVQAAKLGAKGRYWMSRCLLELGQAHEDAGRFDEAQRAYQLIIDQHLGGAMTAQDKLARFRVTEGAKP